MVIVMHDGGCTLCHSMTQELLGHRAVHRALRGHLGARFGIQMSLHLSYGIGIWGWRTVRFHLLAYAALAMESASLENCLLHEVLRKLLLLENSKISPSSASKVFNKCLLFSSFVQFALPNTGLRPARGVRERCETFTASELI